MKIISFKICPFVQRVTALLEVKNIAYDIEYISLKDKPQWFLELAPNGQVPILITDSNIALFESDAIMEYIDEISLPLEPNLTPEKKAINRAWSYKGTKQYLAQCSFMRSSDEKTFLDRETKIVQAFVLLQKEMENSFYSVTNSMSNIDIAWFPLLYRFSVVEKWTKYDILSQYPKMKKWQISLITQNFAKKSVADDFEKLFVDFYLSDKTFLGKMRYKI